MKKIYLSLCALAFSGVSFAQTIANAGFETWRSNSAGSAPTITVNAPVAWNSFDSLTIDALEMYGPLLFSGYSPTDLRAQLFQETNMSHVHGGTSAAKLITVKQDTIGVVPGSLANATPNLNISGTDIASLLSFTGGTATNLRITSVSAWIQYFPGKDSITGVFGANDSGTITVQASSAASGTPTIVGTGTLTIGSTPTFTQYTVNVVYTDTVNFVDSVRIIFSSGRQINALDSSIMYVDDVTMVGVPQLGVKSVINADLVKVFPNPASNVINVTGPQNTALKCELSSVSGQVVASKIVNSQGVIDVASLPAGTYFYAITDKSGLMIKNGKVTVAH